MLLYNHCSLRHGTIMSFIQTLSTPNKNTLTFLPGKYFLEEGSKVYNVGDDSTDFPLATNLLSIDGVINLMFGSDFVSVTKNEEADWDLVRPSVLMTITEFFDENTDLIMKSEEEDPCVEELEEDADVIMQIKSLLETRVRPSVAMDGGDIVYKGYRDGTVYLVMRGACADCPNSSVTLKNGVENMLTYYIPEVIQVVEYKGPESVLCDDSISSNEPVGAQYESEE